ncbi:hypothetical protein Patl1_23787 [Pistacia atlantica]|uniref:Uncharacterized protein n=1 Tax=Pistacia atlantica TaxID=434234 RepID=A0ACC1A118_9ROSI|nr:hypothetical protein Patl1_23787 [Pistacia atlantica]
MAGNVEFDDDDIEHGHNTNQIQTLATPKSEQVSIVEDKEEKQYPSTWNRLLGLEEVVLLTYVWRASLAELIGTEVLVFSLDGIVISSIQTKTNTPNLIIALMAAIIVSILLIATFPISGGHINPIISFSPRSPASVPSRTRRIHFHVMHWRHSGALAQKPL